MELICDKSIFETDEYLPEIYDLPVVPELLPYPKSSPTFCVICQREFYTKQRITAHMIVHIDIKPFACTKCEMTFKRKCNLQDHMGVHSDKKFECSFCPRKFTRVYSRDAHERDHIHPRRFSCDICSKTYTQSGSLKAHLKTHEYTNEYVCLKCEQTFRYQTNFFSHVC
jgi:uncharacterized Zn-finger protein